MPSRVPLEEPPGDPAALADLVGSVTGAAFCAGVLAAHLAGPAARAPGWLGQDAAAAEAQVGIAAGLVDRLHGTLTAAEQRLRAHAGVLDDARRRVAVLRRAQADDFADRAVRSAASLDAGLAVPPDEDLVAAEAARRREHEALIAEVVADARAAAEVLAGATAELGGTGAPGRPGQVRAALAALLPGWGDGEMVALAAAAARRLDGPATAADLDDIARAGLPYAGNTAYAGALLANLGVDGVRWLLTALGQEVEPSAVLARWLATAFGAAPDPGRGPLVEVLDAVQVDPDDPDGVPDQIAMGMAALLAAVPAAAGGVRPGTVAGWGAQILARERRQGFPARDRLGAAFPDPVLAVVDRLAAARDPAASAALLAGRASWDALLARTWDDAGAGLAAVIGGAGALAGAAGEGAVRAGLEGLGNGLSPQGTGVWTVDRATAGAVAPALGEALAAHPGVAGALLGAAGAGEVLDPPAEEALRGLGYLTLDPSAVTSVAATVPETDVARAALVATREYGQRLGHALDALEAMTAAADRRFTYEVTVGLAMVLFDKTVGRTGAGEIAAGILDGAAGAGAGLLGADGEWEVPLDRGLVLDREDAVAAVVGRAPAGDEAAAADRARAAFDLTTSVLGVPWVPTPGDAQLTVPGADEAAELRKTLVETRMGRRGW